MMFTPCSRFYDKDNSGSIDKRELQTAVASFGRYLGSGGNRSVAVGSVGLR